MVEIVEGLFEQVERGTISRREAVGRLVAVAAAAFAGGGVGRGAAAAEAGATDGAGPTFTSRGLNHLALRVTDVPRSRDFYVRHLGLRVMSESPTNCFLEAGEEHFVALFRADRAGMDHYCHTIDGYDPDDVVARLRAVGIEPRRTANRVYFDDPDGLEVQLAARRGG